MVLLGIHGLGGWVGGCVANPDTVRDEPLVDGLCWMRHEDSAFEICLCQHVGQRSGMVNMKAASC